jgi:methyl-accepting chemotaxis protein
MNNMRVTNRFILLLGIFAFSFLLAGWVSLSTLNLAKVNGPIYKGVVLQKDLVADILPPPEYLIEAYFVVQQISQADAKEIPALVSKSKQLRVDYETRHKFWTDNLPDGKVKQLILVDSYKPGIEFLNIRDEKFIPAIQRGDKAAAQIALASLDQKYRTHRQVIDDLVTIVNEKTSKDEAEAADVIQVRTLFMVMLMLISGAFVLVIGLWISRSLLKQLGGEPKDAAEVARRIAADDLSHVVPVTVGDTSSMMATMRTMQQNLIERQDGDRLIVNEMSRIKCALDNVTICVRVADIEGKVVYVNHALQSVLDKYEKAFQQANPNFVASKVVGGSIGVFYTDPPAAIQRLRNLSSTTRTMLVLGGRNYDVVTTPIFSPTGEKLGTVGQWIDMTDQLISEKEISTIVEAAAAGDFTHRIEVKGKDGFYLKMAEDMNRLLQTSEVGLNEVVRVLDALAQGDLTETITNEYSGTFGQLKDDSNATVAQLTETISRIKEAAETISTASKEIASGNTDLSQRTEEQASSLEETAASMEELTSTVKQNAENAKQANQLAVGASDVAAKAGEVVNQVVMTMSSISDSSKKIADIISVIDGIAFQTNILALNAAVEAARAGEQGRGFAVVASEVRNLAQRSAAAAKEIKGLIDDSVSKVNMGADLVDKAGLTMEEVVNSVKRVTDIMGEITAASVEQSQGIEQVNTAITQMDDVTQQNAALVEEAAAAAESMEEQAKELLQLISSFRLQGKRGALPSRSVAQLSSKTSNSSAFSFDDAINAHTKWKARLVNYVKGTSDEQLEVAKVSRDDLCPLGNWLYGPATSYSKFREYEDLKRNHAAFHRGVGDIVQCVHDHKKDEAMQKLGGDFFQQSNKTIKSIKSLQAKVVGESAPKPRLLGVST